MEKILVNQSALHGCFVREGTHAVQIVDISSIRVVTQRHLELEEFMDAGPSVLELCLDKFRFKAALSLRAKGDNWMRLGFDNLLPSCGASLRSFLCARKVGESLIEDWQTAKLRHFHGLNESELWFDADGGVLFTYLDPERPETQFLFRAEPPTGAVSVGSLLRSDYMELKDLSAPLPLLPLSDREVYKKLSECRDIVTNFRPAGQVEYHLKQRLLKLISDTLYSTGQLVERSPRKNRATPLAAASPTQTP
jgi:hypothetical protein